MNDKTREDYDLGFVLVFEKREVGLFKDLRKQREEDRIS